MISATHLKQAFFVALFLHVTNLQAEPLPAVTNKLTAAMSDQPRYENLPLFNPEVAPLVRTGSRDF
ncbi:hypothetical protein KPA93_05370 [Burkholderia cenocepacia]|uniref:hypothetical protein n=1 Tax=Burkholderia cenocepacia TaxID=95486 RepID=UPI00285F9439|nr:hypothetical protein [Burkholderia cenocepacia]MDR8029421.1 hypothetical protein [Burkholderia cenocepacia]MDR8039915.1 hypothetical protein [Burkholderia cenocepacia]